MIAYKTRPVDTTGVAEPLKTFVDALTQPDPARRPQSAIGVVALADRVLRPGRPGDAPGPGIGSGPAPRR